jgi:cyclic pyranopterin monophosphate synthase
MRRKNKQTRSRDVVPSRVVGGWKPAETLSHVDAQGRARMVDVGDKPVVKREAIAEGFLIAAPATLDRLMKGDLPKGDALAVARVAGITAAKRCDELIPLCHTLPLDAVNVDFERVGGIGKDRVRITAAARISARTGVEMEALVAVSIAALTLYDMTKAIDKAMRIEGVRVVHKTKSRD